MKKLQFPIINTSNDKKVKWLSMDEYVRFVEFHLQNTFDEESYKKWKMMLTVDVPFTLK